MIKKKHTASHQKSILYCLFYKNFLVQKGLWVAIGAKIMIRSSVLFLNGTEIIKDKFVIFCEAKYAISVKKMRYYFLTLILTKKTVCVNYHLSIAIWTLPLTYFIF